MSICDKLMNSTFIQLSDFGLAISGGNPNKNSIKLSGTLGYVAPEYLLDGMIEYLKICKITLCQLHCCS